MPTYTHDINNRATLDELTASVNRSVQFMETNEADKFCLFYEQFVRENPTFIDEQPEFGKAYEDLYDKARWVALPLLADEKTVLQMFESRMLKIQELDDFPLVDQVRGRLLSEIVQERDGLKARFRDALIRNKEVITDPFITFGNRLERKGTIGNWVTDYLNFMGDVKNDALYQARYYNEHPVFKTLSPEQQQFLKQIFSVVEMSRLSSETVEGFEQDRLLEIDGQLVEFSQGAFTEVSGPIVNKVREIIAKRPKVDTAALVRERFADPPEMKEKITSLRKGLNDAAGGDMKKLRSAVSRALLPPAKTGQPNVEESVAALRLYTASADLKTLLQDRQLNDLVRVFLEKEKRSIDLDSFKVFPEAPQFVKLFLQIVFEDRLRLKEEEAARQALHIANIARKQGNEKLMDIAYYDEVYDSFRWSVPLRKPREEVAA